jgi:hypothetical protein
MSTYRRRISFRPVAAATVGALASTFLFANPASAIPAAGTNLLVNGNFAAPPPTASGAPPSGWALVDLGAESGPYSASISAYNTGGEYPPPAGDPDPAGIADEVFYEAGSNTGVEGIGGSQASPPLGSITQADDPQVSFSTVSNDAPEMSLANWAGSAFEVNFTSGSQTYTLIYFNPWQASSGTFTGSPINSATVQYIIGTTLTPSTWYTQPARDLNSDTDNAFGLTTYTVNSVVFADLEDTTDSGYPYPNMDGYFADVALDEGGPPASLPEAPLVVLLPVMAALAVGAITVTSRPRRGRLST